MARKEFIRLFESNILRLDKLADRLKKDPLQVLGYPRQQMSVLVRLHIGGPAKLKDIARRECVTTPNLCATFRKLEHDGLVKRTIDDQDRRNTWYAVTEAGANAATEAMEKFRGAIEHLFCNLSRADEEALTAALKTMNNILTNMELNNA